MTNIDGNSNRPEQSVREEISQYMPYEEFVRIHKRLADLRKEEEDKLTALAELQNAYLAAGSEWEQEQVRLAVAQIRELSKAAREEIRRLNAEIARHLPLEQARKLYRQLEEAEDLKP